MATSNTNPIKYSDLVSPDNSITDLIKQLDELSDTYSNALRNIKTEAIQLSQALKSVSGATETGRQATAKASADADKLARAQRELAFAESDNAKKLAELKLATKEANDLNKLTVKLNSSAEGSYNRLSAQYSINKIYLNNMTKAERENTAEGKKLEAETKRIYEEMKRLQEATGKYQLNVGNYTNSILQAVGVNGQFGQSLLAIGKGGSESKMALAGLKDGASALSSTLSGLLANPMFLAIAGITAGATAVKWWYDYNAGIAEATRLTREFLGVSGDGLVQVRSEIQSIAETYGKDYMEVLRGVDTIMSQWQLSAEDALTILERGFQSGADVSGDMLSKLSQFAPTFHDAGIGASELIALIQQTRSGLFSDKGLQVIEMASKRIREMSSGTAKSLDDIGLSSKMIAEQLSSGMISTFEVIQMISAKLKEFPQDSQVVGEVLKDVFGKQGAGAGIQLIESLDEISTDLDKITEQTGEYGESMEELRQTEEDLDEAIAELFDATDNGFESAINGAKALGNYILTGLIKAVTGIVNVFKAVVSVIGQMVTGFGRFVDKVLQAIPFVNEVWSIIRKIAGEFGALSVTGGGKKATPKGRPNYEIQYTGGNDDKGGGSDNKGGGKSSRSGGTSNNVAQVYKANLDAQRKAQDAEIRLMEEGYEKRRKITILQYTRQIEDLRHTLITNKNLTIQGREAINKTILSLEQEQTDALVKLEMERGLKELQVQKEAIALRLQVAQKGSEDEMNLKRQQIEIDEQIALLQNAMKPVAEQLSAQDISGAYRAKMGALADEAIANQLAIFDAEQKLAQSEFDLLQENEYKKTQFRLKAEKERWQKILELNKTASNKMTDMEVQTIQNTIAKINQEIEESKKDERSSDLYSVFGIDLDDKKKQAINQSVGFAMEQLNAYTDALVASADRAVEVADKEVDATQRRLDAELQARANGYANNVEMAQKELDNAKKNQQQAIKERQKAQRQQQAIQSLEQIGNLVTATSQIWSQLGFPWAIPAIAVMWGSFAYSKIKASQMVKESYGEGTVELLQGGSHQSGNDIDLGTKKDGTKRRAEGGEFFAVINKRNSRRYRKIIPDVIRSLNNGTFANRYLNAYDGASEAITLNFGGNTPDIRELNANVRAIKEQGQKRAYTDGNGNMVIEYKNVKRITR